MSSLLLSCPGASEAPLSLSVYGNDNVLPDAVMMLRYRTPTVHVPTALPVTFQAFANNAKLVALPLARPEEIGPGYRDIPASVFRSV